MNEGCSLYMMNACFLNKLVKKKKSYTTTQFRTMRKKNCGCSHQTNKSHPFSLVPMEAKHRDDLYCVALVGASATGLQPSRQDWNLAGHGTDTDFCWWHSGPCSNAYQESALVLYVGSALMLSAGNEEEEQGAFKRGTLKKKKKKYEGGKQRLCKDNIIIYMY